MKLYIEVLRSYINECLHLSCVKGKKIYERKHQSLLYLYMQSLSPLKKSEESITSLNTLEACTTLSLATVHSHCLSIFTSTAMSAWGVSITSEAPMTIPLTCMTVGDDKQRSQDYSIRSLLGVGICYLTEEIFSELFSNKPSAIHTSFAEKDVASMGHCAVYSAIPVHSPFVQQTIIITTRILLHQNGRTRMYNCAKNNTHTHTQRENEFLGKDMKMNHSHSNSILGIEDSLHLSQIYIV